MYVESLLRSPLGRLFGRWLEKGPPGLEIRLRQEEVRSLYWDRRGDQHLWIEIRNRGASSATLTELGLLHGSGHQHPLPSPELVLRPGAVLRLRVAVPDLEGTARSGAGGYRAYVVDAERRQFLSA